MSQNAEFKVWWIPQVPMKPFEFPVPSLDAGILLCEALARYDLFQYENNIKPDYANAGGLKWRHPQYTENRWDSFDPDDEYELAEVRELCGESSEQG